METIKDIIAEMSGLARVDEESDEMVPRKHMSLALSAYASRIEAAAKALEADRDNWRDQAFAEASRANEAQSVTDCNHLNMAKAREALHEAQSALSSAVDHYLMKDDAKRCLVVVNEALSAPARNCDLYQTKDSLLKAIHDDREYLQSPIKERESVVNFILAEAKGETK